jgi:hypothetical protein
MRSDAIVIVGVGLQDSTQMHLAQDNDVVHTLTPVCTENLIRVDDVTESPKLVE